MLESITIPFVGFALVAVLTIYRYIIYPAFISSLSKIPNAHSTCAFSPFWIFWTRYRSRENRAVYAAHQRFGSVVRLGPNEISVNCVDGGIKTVYTSEFEKPDWYGVFGFFEWGESLPNSNMFSTALSHPHSIRKRMVSNVYSKSYLATSPHFAVLANNILNTRFLPIIATASASGNPVEIHDLFFAVLMDMVTAHLFGLSSATNFVQDLSQREWWEKKYMCRTQHYFWPMEFLGLTQWLKKTLCVRLVPTWVDDANRQIEAWGLGMCDAADSHILQATRNGTALEPGEEPLLYRHLRDAMTAARLKQDLETAAETGNQQRFLVAAEMLDHVVAGHETSGITLTYLTHELSSRPELQRKLRAEIATLSAEHPLAAVETAKALDTLPLLQAVLQETLRLHSAIPGPQPRLTPPGGCELGGYKNIPGGVRVQAYAYGLHRNEEVFPEALSWKPERWLNDDGTFKEGGEMGRWFWAFGSGGRMCVGRWLAVRQMKLLIASIWGKYETSIVDDEDIEQEDGYTVGPAGRKLVVRFQEAERPTS